MTDAKYIICTLKDKDFKQMHKIVKETKETKHKLFWGYSIQLYDLCNGKVKLIKRVIKEINKYDHNNKEPTYCKDFYNKLKEEYKLNDNIIGCFLFNEFKIIKEEKI
jgi:hypothetical protein